MARAIPVLPLGRVDHRDPDSILDRATRAEVFELGHDVGPQPLAQAPQGDQRGVANRGRDLRGKRLAGAGC
jgi:hypothetical protein